MKISKAELHTLIEDAQVVFWEVLVKRYPEAKTGELSIDRTIRLHLAAREAVEEWVEQNVPPATKQEA
jgi:hypothetical protein